MPPLTMAMAGTVAGSIVVSAGTVTVGVSQGSPTVSPVSGMGFSELMILRAVAISGLPVGAPTPITVTGDVEEWVGQPALPRSP